MKKVVEISTMNVSIRVLTLDNKRFTKSIYNQLPYRGFSNQIEKQSDTYQIIGYVSEGDKKDYCLLVNNNGRLERHKFPEFLIHDYQWCRKNGRYDPQIIKIGETEGEWDEEDRHGNSTRRYDEIVLKKRKEYLAFGQIFITS